MVFTTGTHSPIDSTTERELLGVLMMSRDATAIYNSEDLKIAFISDAMLQIWGKDRSVVGKTFEQAIPEIVGQPFTALLQNVWRTGETYTAKATPATLNIGGQLQTSYFDFEYRAISDASGQTIYLLHTATDVTARLKAQADLEERSSQLEAANKEFAAINEELRAANGQLLKADESLRIANQELKASKDHLQDILDNMNEGIGLTDLSGNIIYTNEQARKILKISETDVLQRKNSSPEWANRRLDGSLMPHEEHPVSRAIAFGQPVSNQVFLVQAEGEAPLYLHMNAAPIRDEQGTITGAIGIFFDFTAQYELQKAITESEARLRALVTATSDVVYSLSADWEIMRPLDGRGFLKDTQEAITGWRKQNVHADDLNRVNAAISEAIREKKIFELEHRVNRADGSTGWTISRAVPIMDENGEIIEWFGMASDITERKLDEVRKNDFIGMVSHELKTPLTSLSAILQVVTTKVRKTEDNFLPGAIERANQQVKRMTAMINGFLNISRLESGKISIDKQDFNLHELIREVVEEHQMTTPSHVVEINDCNDVSIYADRNKIASVLSNLINNAIKYSPKAAEIKVGCSLNQDMVTVSVSDKGLGIAPHDLPNIFDRYYRSEENNNRHIGGFGIGLYVSAEIIERHNGRIWADSILGTGSTFYFSLPR